MFQGFDRPYRSPDGSLWIISADTDLDTSMDEVIIVGNGVTGNVMVQEGTPAGWTGGENVGLIDRNLGINNAGQFAFATNTSGTVQDEYIVKYDSGAFLAAAQEGAAVPGFAGEVFGATLDSALILNDGTVGFRGTSTVGNLPTDQDDFLFLGTTAVAQSGVTIPGGTALTWQVFDSQDFYASADGSHYIIQGDLTGTTADDIVVVDGTIKIQEDSVISGLTSPVLSIDEVFMSSNGDWMSRGNNDDSAEDWLVMNGNVVAKTGDPVPGVAGEFFSDAVFGDCFFHMVTNNNGDYIFGATTTNSDPEKDAVLVLNGVEVILRQGDPVDLDGNGIFDDDAYLDVFNNDDGFLTDDMWFYFTADLYDGNLASLGQAFMRVQVPEPASLLLVVVGGLLITRRR